MSVIPNEYAECTAYFTTLGAGDSRVVTGHENLTSLSAGAIAEAVFTAYSDNILPLMSDDVSLVRVHCETGEGFQGDAVDVVAGGIALGAVPPAVAVLCKKESGVVGRHNQGRMYLPGIPEANVDSKGTLTSGAWGDWASGVSQWFIDLAVAEVELVILHATALAPTDVTAVTPSTVVATQRRRQRPF